MGLRRRRNAAFGGDKMLRSLPPVSVDFAHLMMVRMSSAERRDAYARSSTVDGAYAMSTQPKKVDSVIRVCVRKSCWTKWPQQPAAASRPAKTRALDCLASGLERRRLASAPQYFCERGREQKRA